MTALVVLTDVGKDFPMASGAYPALRDVSLTIEEGEFVAITGPSGHGKSTLMSILGCLDRPTRGCYRLRGTDVSTLSDDQAASLRGRFIGFVFQSFNLVPNLSALGNVELPMVYARVPKAVRQARALDLLGSMGLEHHAHHRPMQLSGGQQQRVAICRALAMGPNLVLADEPTGNLDSQTSADILDRLVALNRNGCTVVLVTHDPMVAARARREIRVWDGRAVDGGTPQGGSRVGRG